MDLNDIVKKIRVSRIMRFFYSVFLDLIIVKISVAMCYFSDLKILVTSRFSA